MKLGSLFDGSGTAPLAAAMCGIEPVWASEIEPYPIKVTKARFPNMVHLGDITKINGAEVEPVDVLCGGSPCQDLSVAGKQKGLHEGERSHLFFEMTRIIKEMRTATNGRYPKYIIWENVPGAFSSNNGNDFHAVLQAFAEIADPNVDVPRPPCKGKTDRLDWRYAGSIVGDGYSIAWRTVDAQYWGVPQRRRRIYLVADITGECAGEVLFERTGLSGNSESSGTQREEAAGDAGSGIEGSGGVKCLNTVDRTVVAFDITGNSSNSMKSPTPDSCFRERNVGRTLDTFVGSPECNQGGMVVCHTIGALCADDYKGINNQYVSQNKCVVEHVLCIGNGQLNQMSMAEQSNCLDCMHDQQAVVYPGVGITSKQNASNPQPGDPCLTLSTDSRNYLVSKSKPPRKYIVRRLTPLECCRLQGFPDWWEDGVEGSDSARYKMWGNGMALPNMMHVMRGIVAAEASQGETK